MARKKEAPKYNLNVYLMKEGVDNDEEFLDLTGLRAVPITDNEGGLGTLYIGTHHSPAPAWSTLFESQLSDDIKLSTASVKALLVVRVEGRTLCLTFGHAQHVINQLAIQRNFGLRLVLNLGSEHRLKAMDKSSLDVIEIKTREQASKNLTIADFDFDFELDIVKAISARDESRNQTLSGRDSFKVREVVSVTTLRSVLSRYLEDYRSVAYKKKFQWIDNILEVRDSALVDRLDRKTVEAINKQELDTVWLAIPEWIDWESDEWGFSYRNLAKGNVIVDDLDVKSWMTAIKKEEINLDLLKTKHIFLLLNDQSLSKKWPVYRCLCAEVDYDSKKYILSEGVWYEVNQDFVSDTVVTYLLKTG